MRKFSFYVESTGSLGSLNDEGRAELDTLRRDAKMQATLRRQEARAARVACLAAAYEGLTPAEESPFEDGEVRLAGFGFPRFNPNGGERTKGMLELAAKIATVED